MVATVEAMARVSRLAAGQWGLMTVAQAERDGVSRSQLARLAEAGILERMEQGVYAATSSTGTALTLKAAWLALDPTRTAEERLSDPVHAGVVSHNSAASLHHLGDLVDDVPEITYPHRKQTRRQTRLRRSDLAAADVTLVDGLPTTTVERTLADLLRDGQDLEHMAVIVGQAVRRGTVDLSDLARRLEPLARRYGYPNGGSFVKGLVDLAGLSRSFASMHRHQIDGGQTLSSQ